MITAKLKDVDHDLSSRIAPATSRFTEWGKHGMLLVNRFFKTGVSRIPRALKIGLDSSQEYVELAVIISWTGLPIMCCMCPVPAHGTLHS